MRKIALLLLLAVGFTCVFCTSCQQNYTDTVQINSRGTMLIAHRGLSGLEAENTDAAFIAAGEKDYWGIEADLRKTADGRYIICHDTDTARISGVELKVAETTFDELMALDLLDKNGESSPDIHLATLDSFILICKQYGKQAVLELNCDYTREEIGEIISIIDGYGYLDRVTFISFIYDNLLRVRSYLPNQSAQLLFTEYSDELADRLISDRIDAGMASGAVNSFVIEKFHRAGLKVNCWIVDVKISAELLCLLGVDYLTTNILE